MAGIRDFFGGRSGSYGKKLGEAKETGVQEKQQQAQLMGAKDIIGLDLDYETVGESMLMVTAAGTAVLLEE